MWINQISFFSSHRINTFPLIVFLYSCKSGCWMHKRCFSNKTFLACTNVWERQSKECLVLGEFGTLLSGNPGIFLSFRESKRKSATLRKTRSLIQNAIAGREGRFKKVKSVLTLERLWTILFCKATIVFALWDSLKKSSWFVFLKHLRSLSKYGSVTIVSYQQSLN